MMKGTTILGVRMAGCAALGGDGQVTMGNTVIKHGARKIRTLADGSVIAGFAGSTADAFTLFERFEEKLESSSNNLARAAVELAKDWRRDRVLRRLEAMLAVMDLSSAFVVSGTGDVVEPDDDIVAIGSGGAYALAAARAYIRDGVADAEQVVRDALKIAGEICVFTNSQIQVATLGSVGSETQDK